MKTKAQNFVELIEETVEVALETCDTEKELETYVRQSWDFDNSDRRRAFDDGFKEFRQHVMNVLDAEHPEKVFA